MNAADDDNRAAHELVLTGVDHIQETHLSESGLLVLDVAGLDDATVYAFQDAIVRTWAATVDRTTREPGQPGSRLRMYLDLRQPLAPATPGQASATSVREAGSAATGGAAGPA